MSNPPESLILRTRSAFHAGLVHSGTLTVNAKGVASISDGSNSLSTSVGREIATELRVDTESERAAGQTLGGSFEEATAEYLRATFPAFQMLRPGQWEIHKIGNSRRSAIAAYEPYQHLAALSEAIRRDPTLVSVLGNAYAISPDIVVSRFPEPDSLINADARLVDHDHAHLTVIRAENSPRPILHAVVSCKWTLRSDRAQNARSEALNLIRNRKGRLPHIVVVTAEPTPSRLSSLALGTGDVDCVYHIALPELVDAMGKHGNDDNVEMLSTMIEGRLASRTSAIFPSTWPCKRAFRA
ncbi:MAG: NgoMIV family type II restriction endonuclease [Aeromicrobium sp.]|uniref:NgoMIV family type II restriction endonuclease n=1 Tax=Aeromicrobium sp. TaxID=1871063 RepID=UPI0039E5FBED